jgi:hypothetical protein
VLLNGGVMITVAVIGVVVLIFGAAAALRWREADDVHSVDHYHSTLHTLEEVREHVAHADPGSGAGGAAGGTALLPGNGHRSAVLGGSGSVHVLSPAPAATYGPPGGAAVGDLTGPGGPGNGHAGSGPGAPDLGGGATATAEGDVPAPGDRLFDDGQADGTVTAPPGPTTPGKPRRDRAINAMNHRPRQLGAPLLAAGAVLVLVVILLIAGAHTPAAAHHHGGAARAAAAPPPRTRSRAVSHKAKTLPPPTTSSTAPASYAPVDPTASSATYVPATAAYTVKIAVINPCWVEVRSAAGAVVYTGTLQSGQMQAVALTGGPATMILGAPEAAIVTLNGRTVTLPAGYATPFTMTFAPGAS